MVIGDWLSKHRKVHLQRWSQGPSQTISATSQTHIRAFELTLPNIRPIYDLLELGKRLALCNHSCSISMDWAKAG